MKNLDTITICLAALLLTPGFAMMATLAVILGFPSWAARAARRALRPRLARLAAFWGQYSPRAVLGQVFRGIMADVNESRRLWAEIRSFPQFRRDPAETAMHFPAGSFIEHRTIGSEPRARIADIYDGAKPFTHEELMTPGPKWPCNERFLEGSRIDMELVAAYEAQDPDTRAFHEVRRMIDQA